MGLGDIIINNTKVIFCISVRNTGLLVWRSERGAQALESDASLPAGPGFVRPGKSLNVWEASVFSFVNGIVRVWWGCEALPGVVPGAGHSTGGGGCWALDRRSLRPELGGDRSAIMEEAGLQPMSCLLYHFSGVV